MRYLKAENPYIIVRFTTGNTVKITIYDLSDNSKTVDDVNMTEVGSTGYFKYQFNPSPGSLTEYLYISNNTIEEHAGKVILGGFPDGIKDETDKIQTVQAQTDKLNFTGTDVKATLDSEMVGLSSLAIDNILDEVVEGTLTMRGILRLVKSSFAGKSSGGGTTNIKFRDDADVKDRIDMTVDDKGNRSEIILDAD